MDEKVDGAPLRFQRVERAVEESDRRRSVLQLTPRGHAVYREVVPLALAYEDAVLRGLPARARQKLDSLLDDLQRRARSLRSARLLRESPKEAAAPALREPRTTRTSRE